VFLSQISRGFLLHVFQLPQGDKTLLCAVGRLECGETFAVMDNRHRPCFYVRQSDVQHIQDLEGAKIVLQPCGMATLDGEEVVRLSGRGQALKNLAVLAAEKSIRTYESDISFVRQVLMDWGVRGGVELQGDWRVGEGVDRVYFNPVLRPAETEVELAVLSLDIETTPEADQVLAVSLVGTGPQVHHRCEEILLVGPAREDDPPEARCFADEKSLLVGLFGRVAALDPDILTGWNVIDFDLRVLEERSRHWRVRFNLGRSREVSRYLKGRNWGGSRAVIYGRQVLDALHLVRSTLQRYDDYRLGTVAQAVLGRGKVLDIDDNDGDDEEGMPQRIERAYHFERAVFCQYCLEDARLVRDILQAEGLLELTLRRSQLTGLPLERAWGSVAAFDFLYLGQLHRRGVVAPTLGVDQAARIHSAGGLVMAARAGLYGGICVFDFKSLYPSIMRTFNIDPLSLARAGDDGDIIAPNGARFSRDEGILPGILERFWQSREQAKSQGDALAAYTYKILMNSFYGVLATSSCRLASAQLAGAITGWGHYVLRWIRRWLEDEGVEVLYGDTDSVFVDMGFAATGIGDNAANQKAGRELCRRADQSLRQHLEAKFGVESRLELEFEKYYRRFLLPPMRHSEKGRAKGYAGLRVHPEGERLEIVGMEAVRRDWTDLAHQLQRDLLALLFEDAPMDRLEACVSAWVAALYAGRHDEMLVYRRGLRKKVEDYTRSAPPHVKAARLMKKPRGVIRYVLTHDGPQPLEAVRSPLDYDHYLQKQIEPIVRTLAGVCDLDVEAAVHGMPSLFGKVKI
jgi:DNA polymerase II